MKRYRRLRRLVPDAELFRRGAAGETLRALAADYGVSHTTLSRFFARPDSVEQLRRAAQVLRAERRTASRERRVREAAERESRRRAAEPTRPSPSRAVASGVAGRAAGGRAARAHASDPYRDWLERPKFGNLAAGLVRLEAVDGRSKRWVEPEQVEELVNSGNYRRV